MIKRPLIAFFFFTLAGIYLQKIGIGFLTAALVTYAVITLSVIICFRNKRLRAKYISKSKIYESVILLIILPFVLTGAFFRCFWHEKRTSQERKPYKILVEQNTTQVILEGKVKSIDRNEDKLILILKKCKVRAPENSEYTDAGNVRVYLEPDAEEEVCVGNEVRVFGKIKLYEHATNQGQFDAYEYNLKSGTYAYISSKEVWITDERCDKYRTFVSGLRERMRMTFSALYSEENAGIMTAMLVGDRGLMDEETGLLYKNAGISHILAVSGLHISLICMGLYELLARLFVPKRCRIVIAVLFLSFFVVYTGMGVSALRAGIMMCVLLLSKLLRRHYDMPSSLAFAATIILFINPYEVKDASFILSVLAVAGVYFGGRLKAGYFSGGIITLVSLPAVLWFFFETSLYGTITNIIVLPLCSAILVLGLLSGVFGIIFLPLGGMFAGAVHLLLGVIKTAGELISRLPYSFVCTGRPEMWKIVVFYAVFLLATAFFAKKRKAAVKVALTMAPFLLLLFVNGNKHSFSFLDVGQGDSFVLFSGRECVVVDNGSSDKGSVGKYILTPYLKYNGRTSVDTFIVTHTDDDHINGLTELLEAMEDSKNNVGKSVHYNGRIEIHNVVLPKVLVKGKAYLNIEKLAEDKGVNVIYAEQGHCFMTQDGKAGFVCLAPKEAGKSENGTSLVYKLETDDFTVFLMGDADKKEEVFVLSELNKNRYKSSKEVILKAGHHGSRTASSEELLDGLKPDCIIISCGRKNRYGHPHTETLEIIESKLPKTEVMRTDENGQIIFKKHTK